MRAPAQTRHVVRGVMQPLGQAPTSPACVRVRRRGRAPGAVAGRGIHGVDSWRMLLPGRTIAAPRQQRRRGAHAVGVRRGLVVLAAAWPLSLRLAAWERTAWIAAATQLVTLVGFGLALPFLPLYVEALGVSDRAAVAVWSGVLAGSAALSMAVMAPIWGALADRYGRKPMLVRSMLGGALIIGAMGFVGDPWQLEALRLVQGGVTGSQAAAAALVAAAAPSGQVGIALGLVSTAVQVGNAVGPAVGGLTVGSLGFRGSFILGGALLLVAGLMAVVWIDEPRSARPVRTRPAGGLWAGTLASLGWPGFRSLLLLQLGTQFVFSASVGLLPLYLQDLDRPAWLSAELASGLAITLTALLAALSMPFLGAWTDRRGPYGLLSLSLVGAAAVLVVQALVPTVGLILAMRALFGVWLAGVTATSSVLTKRAAPPGSEGAAYGAASSAQGLGWGLGPILGAGLVALGGFPALLLVCGGVMLALLSTCRSQPLPVPRRARA
jgi:DHA1 family multidrug resistance protein-like MFS transporter